MTTPGGPERRHDDRRDLLVRLSHDGGKTLPTAGATGACRGAPRARQTSSGPGELDGGKPRINSDKIAMTRWLEREIESILFPPSTDSAPPVIEVSFERRKGNPRGAATERRVRDDEIVLTWTTSSTRSSSRCAPGYREPADRLFTTSFLGRSPAQVTPDGEAGRQGGVGPEKSRRPGYRRARALAAADGGQAEGVALGELSDRRPAQGVKARRGRVRLALGWGRRRLVNPRPHVLDDVRSRARS